MFAESTKKYTKVLDLIDNTHYLYLKQQMVEVFHMRE